MPMSANNVRQLLGRETQLAVAEPLLADLFAGRGRLLVLAGEPGIGKTRLAEEVVERARARGASVAWATTWPGDGAPPLWLWVQVVRQVAGSTDVLDQHVEVTPSSSAALRFAQLDAIAELLRVGSLRAPLVVVLDDIHWADDASLRVLAFAVAALRDAACLFLATYRVDELRRETAAELARLGTTLAVPPLPDDAAADLLRAAVGADVAPAAMDEIVARSAGNPLFVWELGQLLVQTGRLDLAPAAVPGAVASIIERRLARLSEQDVALVRAGAIAGDPFTPSLVAALAEVPFEGASAGLATAAAAGVLHEEVPGRFGFSHALVRDVVLEGIDVGLLAELHRRAALAFATAADTDPSFHAVVADHLLRAGPAHAGAASVRWEAAAQHALRIVAYVEAATLYGRAADASAGEPVRVARMAIEQGDALLAAGDLSGARSCFTRAAAMARVHGEPALFARAVLGIGTGPVAWEVPLADEAHGALVADALAMLPADEVRLRSMLLARLSVSAATPTTHDLARQRAEAALALADEADDPALAAQALAALNDAIAGPANTMARRENADTIVELARTAGDRALELLGYRFRVVADLELGDIAAVDRDIAAFERLANDLRQPLASWYVPLFRGMRALLDGDLERAALLAREVAAAADETGSSNAVLLGSTLDFGLDLLHGRVPNPGPVDEVVDFDAAVWASYASATAAAALHSGDSELARSMLMLHAENSFSRLGDDGETLTSLMQFGRVAIALGELVAAQLVYDRLLPHSGLWCVDGIAACCWAPVDLELGRLAIALGRPATEHLARARDAIERAGAPMLAFEVAELERTTGERSAAAPATAMSAFRRDGQFWTLAYRGRTVRLKDAKGLRDVARLLADPSREIHVLDLIGPSPAEVQRSGDLGELLDARARGEYRRRLAELDDEVADAEACADLGRLERARDERDFLAAELSSALGLGGRPRRAGDPAERARKAVSGRIRMTIGRIADEHPELGRHLEASIRTGTFCAYVPELEVAWDL